MKPKVVTELPQSFIFLIGGPTFHRIGQSFVKETTENVGPFSILSFKHFLHSVPVKISN